MPIFGWVSRGTGPGGAVGSFRNTVSVWDVLKVKNVNVKKSLLGKSMRIEESVKGVLIATNLNEIVLALRGSCSSKSSLGSDAISLASVSGSSKFLPTPTLNKFILSYLESSLHYNMLPAP